jgi:hypothetical protein
VIKELMALSICSILENSPNLLSKQCSELL